MARRLIVVLGALSAFGPLSIDMYLPGLPSMTADLSAPASAAQLTVTACLIGLEACGTSHHWARTLRELGHDVRLIPPAYVKPFVTQE